MKPLHHRALILMAQALTFAAGVAGVGYVMTHPAVNTAYVAVALAVGFIGPMAVPMVFAVVIPVHCPRCGKRLAPRSRRRTRARLNPVSDSRTMSYICLACGWH